MAALSTLAVKQNFFLINKKSIFAQFVRKLTRTSTPKGPTCLRPTHGVVISVGLILFHILTILRLCQIMDQSPTMGERLPVPPLLIVGVTDPGPTTGRILPHRKMSQVRQTTLWTLNKVFLCRFCSLHNTHLHSSLQFYELDLDTLPGASRLSVQLIRRSLVLHVLHEMLEALQSTHSCCNPWSHSHRQGYEISIGQVGRTIQYL